MLGAPGLDFETWDATAADQLIAVASFRTEFFDVPQKKERPEST